MKLSEMFELKKDKPQKDRNKMSHEVFMGIMFIVCAFIQGVLFEIIEHVYALPETNTFLDTCAMLLMFLSIAAGLLCFADHLYRKNPQGAIVLVVVTIIIVFFAVIFTVMDLTEVYHG